MSEYDAIYEVELELQLRDQARSWKRQAESTTAEFHERLARDGIGYTIRWNAEAAIGAEFLSRTAEYLIGLLDDGRTAVEAMEAVQHQLAAAQGEAVSISTTSLFAEAEARAKGRAALRATEMSWRPSYAADRTRQRIAGELMTTREELRRARQLAVDRMVRARSEQSRERHQSAVDALDGELAECEAQIEARIEYAKAHNHPMTALIVERGLSESEVASA